jgi:hypothetical protein
MPAPTDITTLSTTAASNSPAGTESPIIADDCLRAAYGFIAQLRDGAAFTSYVRAGTGGSATVPAFSVVGDTNTGAWFPGANIYSIATNGAEALRVDGSGRLVIGTTTAVASRVGAVSITGPMQLAGTTSALSTSLHSAFSATTTGSPYIMLAKSKHATLGSHTAIVAGDTVGNISFAGSDGTQFCEMARIKVVADTGTVATDTVYGQMEFMVTNGSANPSTVLTINSDGTTEIVGDTYVTGTLYATGALRSTASDSPIGYNAGAGGTVTQLTSKSTSVTLDRPSGRITLHAASLSAATSVSFLLLNTSISLTDIVIVNISNGATENAYTINVTEVATGICRIQLRNESAGALAEAIDINFAVINGASS